MAICGNCSGGNPCVMGGGGPNNERLTLEVLKNIDRNLGAIRRLLEDRAIPVPIEVQASAPFDKPAVIDTAVSSSPVQRVEDKPAVLSGGAL